MPELPEVEIIKRSLLKMVIKAKIIDIKINNKNLRYKIPNNFSSSLIGEKILKIKRRSKYLIFCFKKKILLVHLGMSGKIFIIRKNYSTSFKKTFYHNINILEKHNHIYFKLNNGFYIIYNDVRRFGFLKLYKNTKIKQIPFLSKLGIEPFNKKFNQKYFQKFISDRKKNIKNLLLDQTFVSGLGNIYANEVLFESKISPLRGCKNLSKNEIRIIIKNIKKILKLSISKGGSSIKDFKDTKGISGKFQQFFKVYGRQNKNCSRVTCNNKIKKIKISNRSSYYCSECQS